MVLWNRVHSSRVSRMVVTVVTHVSRISCVVNCRPPRYSSRLSTHRHALRVSKFRSDTFEPTEIDVEFHSLRWDQQIIFLLGFTEV